jgi:hypothetical protein
MPLAAGVECAVAVESGMKRWWMNRKAAGSGSITGSVACPVHSILIVARDFGGIGNPGVDREDARFAAVA